MRISDVVAEYIRQMLDESNGTAEIQRNELANNIGCVPSQINYVIRSRFTQEQGYVVESRRGGGGYIRITRICFTTDKGSVIMHIVNSVGNTLDELSAAVILENLCSGGMISDEVAKIITAGVSERVLSQVPKELRNMVRATVFKNMLLTLV